MSAAGWSSAATDGSSVSAADSDALGVLAELNLGFVVETSAAFYAELEDIVNPAETTLTALDYAIRAYVAFAAQFYDRYLLHEDDLRHCVEILLDSSLFDDHADRCTDDLIELATSDPSLLEVTLCVLLVLGQRRPHTLRALRRPHAVVQSSARRSVLQVLLVALEQYGQDGVHVEGHGKEPERTRFARTRLGPTAAVLLYEVCKVSRLEQHELALFSPEYILLLFRLVESTRDEDEQFNYALIRVLIALNEQYMVASLGSTGSPALGAPTHKRSASQADSNVVIRTLRQHPGAMKTFGENLIFQLNRLDGSAENLCVALLILKVLYVLFTSAGTADFLYLNDACVLVDIIMRELVDLPEESEGLRHTYLRVLHPLLNNTQLRSYPYKRHQLRRVLHSLVNSGHLRDVNATTQRLVDRNIRSEWCTSLEPSSHDSSLHVAPEIRPAGRVLEPERHRSTSPEPHAPERGARSGSYDSHSDSEGSRGSSSMPPPRAPHDRRAALLRHQADMSASTVSVVNATTASRPRTGSLSSAGSPPGSTDSTLKPPSSPVRRRPPPPRPLRGSKASSVAANDDNPFANRDADAMARSLGSLAVSS